MQSINVAVINPWFLSVFLGLVGLCALAALTAAAAFCLAVRAPAG